MTETLNSQAEFLAGEVGLEPTVHGIKIRCLTNLAIPQGAPKAATKGAGLDSAWILKWVFRSHQRTDGVLQTAPGISSFPAFASKVRARGDVKFPSPRGYRNRNRLK